MSGIAGVYFPDGRPVDHAVLARMLEALAHRGPDGAALWSEGSLGLGHRMLQTTPSSLRERLPLVLTDEAGTYVLTADARLDHREELIASLGLTDRPSDEITDGELILRAYQRWGERCPERLLGDFAFALWDARRRGVFCARDPMGVKPFYYYHRPGKAFVFASEIKALFCWPEVPRRLNESRVADYLMKNFDDLSATFYQGIFRLPAACRMMVGGEDARPEPYWALDLAREVRLGSDEEYAEALRELFTAAVRCHLRSAFPVGCTLSGGLDSSSIACVARDLLAETKGAGGKPLHTFSAIFPSLMEVDPRIDERRYIHAVLATGGFEPHFVRADQVGPLIGLLWQDDEAIPAPNLYLDWVLFGAAREQGVRVVLHGWDGDSTVSHGYEYLEELACAGRWADFRAEAEALSRRSHVPPWRYLQHYGFPYLAELARARRWAVFAEEARGIARHFGLSHRDLLLRRGLGRILVDHGLRPLAPEPLRWVWRAVRRRARPLPGASAGINADFARRVGWDARVRAWEAASSAPAPMARAAHARSLTSGLLRYGVELLDRAAAAFAVEPRYPFLDRRLMEFCVALPPEQKLHLGVTRAVMHRAMAGVIPEEVQTRFHKGNLGANFKGKFLEQYREVLEECLVREPQLIEKYLDGSRLRAAYRRYASDPMTEEEGAQTVFLAVVLALWLRYSGLA